MPYDNSANRKIANDVMQFDNDYVKHLQKTHQYFDPNTYVKMSGGGYFDDFDGYAVPDDHAYTSFFGGSSLGTSGQFMDTGRVMKGKGKKKIKGKGDIGDVLGTASGVADLFGLGKKKKTVKGKGIFEDVGNSLDSLLGSSKPKSKKKMKGGVGMGVSRNEDLDKKQMIHDLGRTGDVRYQGGSVEGMVDALGSLGSRVFGGQKKKGKGVFGDIGKLYDEGIDTVAPLVGGKKKVKGGKLVEKSQMKGSKMSGGKKKETEWTKLIKEVGKKHPELKGLKERIAFIKKHDLY